MVEHVLLVALERFVIMMALQAEVKVVLKFVTTVNGELYVMTIGALQMLELLVTNWDITPNQVLNGLNINFITFIQHFTGASAYCCANFGQGYGKIWFDNVACSGSENSLFSCSKNSIGSHNCGHYEDAGAYCYGNLLYKSRSIICNPPLQDKFLVHVLMVM